MRRVEPKSLVGRKAGPLLEEDRKKWELGEEVFLEVKD